MSGRTTTTIGGDGHTPPLPRPRRAAGSMLARCALLLTPGSVGAWTSLTQSRFGASPQSIANEMSGNVPLGVDLQRQLGYLCTQRLKLPRFSAPCPRLHLTFWRPHSALRLRLATRSRVPPACFCSLFHRSVPHSHAASHAVPQGHYLPTPKVSVVLAAGSPTPGIR